MYLKSLKIENFRKFGEENNLIEFVSQKNSLSSDEINIAKATTLVVGKNNAGKTTITEVLEKLLEKKSFGENDYNFSYLNNLLQQYKQDNFEYLPKFEFELEVGLEESDTTHNLITNIVPFMNIESTEKKDFKIVIKYLIVEETEFKEEINKVIAKYGNGDNYVLFQKYLECIANTKKKIQYYNENDDLVQDKFKLSNLIDIKPIQANKIISDNSLSSIFNKIVQYKYKTENLDDMNDHIDTMNKEMTQKVTDSHDGYINNALHSIESKDKLSIRLSSDINFDILMKQLIKYSYVEQGLSIPQGQFGLGYSNLMTIIGEIIDYIEQYSEDTIHSKLNLICIEEPEAFMHPQMQELFIKNINEAITHLLNGSSKKINSQLIVTTHSSHILNSKIHTSNSFDNINYITIIDNKSTVVNLHDNNIINGNDKSAINDLKFIKKHIKHKVSELFFSDAIIFVEGITEETLLNYYIDNNKDLSKYYISIFNINGAHGLVYHNLIKLLKIPTIVVTDLDIKRDKSEKGEKYKENGKNKIGEFTQITDLNERVTTNVTISKYHEKNNINDIPTHFEDENLYITFQSQTIEGYYPTSLEEAYILTNYNNDILNSVLTILKPNIYNEIVGDPINKSKLKENSFKLQKKLSSSKSDFANELLYQLSINEDSENEPKLPNYIVDALDWLKEKLNPDEATS